MKKIIALILILAIVTIILTGCAPMPKYEEEKNDNKMFMIIEDYTTSKVLVDRETNVMYWESWAGQAYGILTLLVDQDGKPKIWNGGK